MMSDASPGDRIARLTPEERAALERSLLDKRSHTSTETIPHLPRDKSSLRLSFAQERLWFIEQLEPGTSLYNVSRTFRLIGSLVEEALHDALDTIVTRHEVIRTTYNAMEGSPVQLINPPCPVDWAKFDLSTLSKEDRDSEVQRLVKEEAYRPFDLSRDLMLRARLFHLATNDHVLLLVMHHIATDGWSTDILLHELSVLYNAKLNRENPVLPELAIQYADYALWQREHLTEEVLKRELAYWKEQLADLSPTLNLPFDRPRNPSPDYHVGRVPIKVPDQVTQELKRLAREENVTLFMVLLAGFMTLLYRYTDEEDIAVGIPIAGRLRTDTENLIGFFVNGLVLRGDLSHEPTFRQLLRRVRNVCLNAYDHQELPFEKLVAELRPERHLSQSPLFQVVFSLDNTPTTRIDLGPNVIARKVATHTGMADFDLALFMRQDGNHLTGTLKYSTALFNKDIPHRMPIHFGRLLEEISLEPDKQLPWIQIMTDEERYFLIGKHGTARETPRVHTTIHRLFEEQAARRPDSPAVIHEEGVLSYRELDRQANRLANDLRSRGVGPEVLVGVCMTRSPEMLVGILAVLKVGGAYLPLNPHHPRQRLERILEDADIQLLLTQDGFDAPSIHANTLTVDLEQPRIQRQENLQLTAPVEPSNLAYVIYTSGSTGTPNGVMVEHRSLVSRIQALARLYDFHAEDRQLHLLSPTFDAAYEEIFLPLAVGAAIVLPPGDRPLPIDEFLSICADFGVTKVNMPSSYWHKLVDALVTASRRLPDTLRLVVTGAEPPSRQRLLEWIPRVRSDLQFYNVYGPTETTIIATTCHVPLDLEKISHWKRIPIGRPIEETEIYILDRHLQPVPIGIPGELCIGGIGLARGYLNRPSLTKEKFIPNPFTDEPNARLYKTGDLARYLPDGNIDFLGRADRQIKIRGHRIELREIELTIESHPLVNSCHASASTLAEDDVRLVAYVVCTGDKQNIETTLRQYLQQRLPGYMLPAAFVFLEALPLLPSGKIDRRALPLPEWNRGSSFEQFVPPTSETEKKLARICEEVLKLDRVGITDNFFELGGHSLLAVRLINRIEETLGVLVPIRILFDQPTITEIASFIDNDSTEDVSV